MAYTHKQSGKTKFQWFLVYFLFASLVSSYTPEYSNIWNIFYSGGKKLMIATLFFIGAGISLSEIKKIGIKPLIQAVMLWIFISVISFYTISNGYISI
jgi:uncharacterized membrane protein YadS